MGRRLLVIEGAFLIPRRGLVLVPEVHLRVDERLRVGDPILLKKPDGSTIRTNIGGIEVCCGSRNQQPQCEMHVLLREMSKEDAPPGTEVWTIGEPPLINAKMADTMMPDGRGPDLRADDHVPDQRGQAAP
jgi:hypothetical protein